MRNAESVALVVIMVLALFFAGEPDLMSVIMAAIAGGPVVCVAQ